MNEEKYEKDYEAIEEISFEQAKQMVKDGAEITRFLYVNLCRGIWEEVVNLPGTAVGKPQLFSRRLAEELESASPPMTRFYSIVVQPTVSGPGSHDVSAPGCLRDSKGKGLNFISTWKADRRIFNAAY